MFINYFLCFLFRRMSDGAHWTNIFAASTEYDATVGDYLTSFRVIFLFKFESFHVAEIGAFAASYAFFVIYLWVPRYLVPRNPFIIFFRHFSFTVKNYYIKSIKNYMKNLFLQLNLFELQLKRRDVYLDCSPLF